MLYDIETKILPLTPKLKMWITQNAKVIVFENNKSEFQIDKELDEGKKLGVEFWKYNCDKSKTKVRITKYKYLKKV